MGYFGNLVVIFLGFFDDPFRLVSTKSVRFDPLAVHPVFYGLDMVCSDIFCNRLGEITVGEISSFPDDETLVPVAVASIVVQTLDDLFIPRPAVESFHNWHIKKTEPCQGIIP